MILARVPGGPLIPAGVPSTRRALSIALIGIAVGCTCSPDAPSPPAAPVVAPTPDDRASAAAVDPTSAAPTTAAECFSERCLASLLDVASEWSVLARLGVPDPDSVVWIEEEGRRAYVAAARLAPEDVPEPCRPADADCYATWQLHVLGVERSASGCPRATLEVQLLLTEGDASDEIPVGAPRRFTEDFVGLEELDARECEAMLDAEEEVTAGVPGGPLIRADAQTEAPPALAATGPIACADLGPSTPVFEGVRHGEALVLTRQVSGTPSGSELPLTFALDPADLDGDGTEEGIVTLVSDLGGGERERDCGNYGECNQGVVVRCDTGWAMVLVPSYRTGLAVSTTHTVYAQRSWRVLVETLRLGGSAADEAERMDQGRPLFSERALVMGPDGYVRRGAAEWFESGECARLYRAGHLAEARAMCEQGLVAHPRGRVRGALYYDLGRVAEAEGRIEDAREAYRRSLDAREDATVRARLDALPAP
jgi:hypothetical protein